MVPMQRRANAGTRTSSWLTRRVSHVLVGGMNGKLNGGRHIAYPSKTVPTGNLLLSILDMYDIHKDSIGDSTGRLEKL